MNKRLLLWQRASGICPDCGKKMLLKNPRSNAYMTVDHIVPKSVGGTNNIENLRATCKKCNQLRGSTPLPDYVCWMDETFHWRAEQKC